MAFTATQPPYEQRHIVTWPHISPAVRAHQFKTHQNGPNTTLRVLTSIDESFYNGLMNPLTDLEIVTGIREITKG